jgi:hypothetical protein
MRLEVGLHATPRLIFEVGDYVRMRRDEPGAVVTAREGEWGRVRRVGPAGIDVVFAGHSRPAHAALSVGTGLPAWVLEPCDRRGVALGLRRDIRRRA